jgi:hypothetical protein
MIVLYRELRVRLLVIPPSIYTDLGSLLNSEKVFPHLVTRLRAGRPGFDSRQG